MGIPLRPELRDLEMVPLGNRRDLLFALRDPEGFSEPVVVPYGGALLAALMDGKRTLAQIQAEFKRQVGVPVALNDLERLIGQLDEACLLEGERFEALCRSRIESYLKSPVRPASHAGQSYAGAAEELTRELSEYFTCDKGPGPCRSPARGRNGRPVCGVVSPHIDPYRGGPAFAWAYQTIAERARAALFVIFGTAHTPMGQPFSICRKDFATPLGVARTDNAFIDRLLEHLGSSVAGRLLDPFEDALAHRREHSIEFQVVFLQHALGPKRCFRIVPILVGSFHELLENGTHPDQSPEIQAFVAAVRAAAAGHRGDVCYISAADLAHIGQRFGDDGLLDDQRLAEQSDDDRKLLAAACRGEGAAFFQHVADQKDRSRICGLAPTYTLLEVIRPARGELLIYDQAVDADRTSCVSFASVAFYREDGLPSGEPRA